MPVIHTGKKQPKFGNFGGKYNTDLVERLMSAFCYLTMGLGGLVYILIGGKYANTRFFRTHFLQAMLLGIFGALLGWTSSALTQILGGILQMIPGFGPEMILILPVTVGFIIKAGYLICVYGIVMSLMSKDAPIPIITKIVNQRV